MLDKNEIINAINKLNKSKTDQISKSTPLSQSTEGYMIKPTDNYKSNKPPNNNESNNKNDANSSNKPNISINLNATEILRILITEHFWGTACLLLVCIGVYISLRYDISFIPILKDIIVNSPNNVNNYVIIAIMIIITIFFSNKISAVMRQHEITRAINNTIYEEFRDLKETIVKLSQKYNSLTNSVDMLSELISENIIDVRKMVNVLDSVNDTIKRIPDKGTIIDILTIRTKLIFGNVIEIISEYFSSIITANKSKRSFIENKLKNKLIEIKIQYLNEINSLSKNTIDENIRDQISKYLDESFDSILSLILETDELNINIDVLMTNIGYIVKDLTIRLINLYDSNLMLTTFFEENDGP